MNHLLKLNFLEINSKLQLFFLFDKLNDLNSYAQTLIIDKDLKYCTSFQTLGAFILQFHVLELAFILLILTINRENVRPDYKFPDYKFLFPKVSTLETVLKKDRFYRKRSLLTNIVLLNYI